MRIASFILVLGLLIGSAQAQFIPERIYTLPGGSLSHFLAKGDFNHDGKLDVLLSGTNSSSQQVLVVFPGDGAGGFGAAIVTPITGLNSLQIGVAGDLNGDGVPDAVITGMDPIQGITEIGVLLANGAGKFKAPVFTRTSVAGTMVLGDFTGDGKTDLVVLSGPAVTVFPGKGDGSFGLPISASSTAGGCVAVADFNKDGKLDLATGRDVLLGNGDGTFKPPITQDLGCDIAVGDFNKDGVPDIVAGGTLYPYETKIFLGTGDGTFAGIASFPSLGYHSGFASGRGFTIAKFSGDTNFDIAVSYPASNDVTMLLGNGDGTFTIGKTFAVSTFGILSGDFNGDGKIDLAVQTKQGISVLLGKGDGTLTAQTVETGQLGTAIRLADFNGDGKTDAVEFSGPTGNRSAVLLGNGDGTFGIPILMPCQASTGVVADFNGDKKPDIAISLGSGGGVEICLGKGDGTFKSATVFDAGVQHGQLLVGDFNHDGKLDLAATDVGGISILPGNGDGTFKNAIPTGASNFVNLASGDFNHDGKLDIASNSNGEITVLLGKGDGTFQSPITSPNVNGFGLPAAGDLNNDGHLDLVTMSSNAMNVLLGNGDGTFKAPTSLKVFGPESFQVRDVNDDGKLDLIVAAPGFLDVILGNGNGTFQAPKNFPAPQGTVSFAAADINGDGLLDVTYLVRISGVQFGTLTVYLNQGH